MEGIFRNLSKQACPLAVDISFSLGNAFIPCLSTGDGAFYRFRGNTKISLYERSQEHVYLRNT